MILDKGNLFSENQAITATDDSQYALELPENVGRGKPVPLLIQVTQDFAAAGAATLEVALQDSSSKDAATFADVVKTPAIALATLKAGYKIPLAFVPYSTKKYIRLNYTVATGPMTAGKITAGIVADVQSNG